MTEPIPAEAVDLACQAAPCNCGGTDKVPFHDYECIAGMLEPHEVQAMLEAAAPVLRAAERERLEAEGWRPPVVQHGTNSGYTTHFHNGTEPCQPCRDAHTAYDRERRARKEASDA